MSQMSQVYAKAAAILSVSIVDETQSVRVQFHDTANQVYSLDFPELVLGGLVTALIAAAPQLKPSGKPQTMNLTSGRVYYIDDRRAGLELVLEGSLRVSLIFPKEGINSLRKSLDEFERKSADKSDQKPAPN